MGKKKLIIIDEFPYMCKGNKSIPSILQNLWDGELRETNVMIILCGSAMSFIEKELLAEKNPLYGRTPVYNSIIEAVVLGNTTLNNISQKSLVEDTSKTRVYLKNLMELGIVEREFVRKMQKRNELPFRYTKMGR